MASSLWPESSNTQTLTNLRLELHHLRNTWPRLDGRVDAGSRTLAWPGAGAVVDLVAFEAAADRSGGRPCRPASTFESLRSFDRVGDQAPKMIMVDRLDEVMVEPVLQCVHRVIRRAVASQGE
jgi:hypothetical protein